MSTSPKPVATPRDAPDERRAFPRFALSMPVHLTCGEVTWTARTVDVSACGILASASLTLSPAQPVELWFRFPGSVRVVALDGHVVRCEVPGADGAGSDRMAVAFDRAAFADRDSLSEALARSVERRALTSVVRSSFHEGPRCAATSPRRSARPRIVEPAASSAETRPADVGPGALVVGLTRGFA